jgi:hypothetical protein
VLVVVRFEFAHAAWMSQRSQHSYLQVVQSAYWISGDQSNYQHIIFLHFHDIGTKMQTHEMQRNLGTGIGGLPMAY